MKNVFAKLVLVIALLTFAFSSFTLVGINKQDEVEAVAQEGKAIDIYLIAGQSNAVGSTKISSGTTGVDPSIYYENVWYAGEAHKVTGGTTGYNIDLSENRMVTQGMGYTTNHIGPELGMAHFLNEHYGTNGDRDVAIVKTAAGGTTLLLRDVVVHEADEKTGNSFFDNYGSWYPESLWKVKDKQGNDVSLWEGRYYYQRTGLQYRAFVNNIKEEYDYLVKQGYTDIKFKALIWMQGESDRGNPTEYAEVFPIFVSDLRNRISELTGDDYSKKLAIVAGEISQTFGSASDSSIATNNKFNNMLNDLTGTIDNMFTIPSAGFDINDPNGGGVVGSDSSHWNYDDMFEIGKLFGEIAYKSETVTKRLYLSKESRKTSADPEKPSADFTTSSYFLDGENEVTLSFTMARKFTLEEFGVYSEYSDENKVKRSLIDRVSLAFENNKRVYTITLPVDAEYMVGDEMRCYVVYGDTPKIEVDPVISSNDYGNNVVVENSGIGYANAPFSFTVFPKPNGRVKSITVGGQPFAFDYSVNSYTIDNLSDYWDGKNSVVVRVDYEKADEFAFENLKTSYFIGEKYESNYTVKLVDNQGVETVLSEGDYKVEGVVDVTKEGIYSLTFSKFGAESKTIDIEVKYPTIQLKSAQLIYFVGESFNKDSIEIEVLGVNGEMKTLDKSEYVVDSSAYDNRITSSYLVKVSAVDTNYGWFTYYVEVMKEFTAQITGAKTEFYVGNEFSVGNNFKVMVTDADGTRELSDKYYTVDYSDYDNSTAGVYEIRVNVQKAGVIAYEITVNEKATLEVLDYKEVYYVGESFRDTSTSKNITVNKILGGVKEKLSRGKYTVDYSAFDNTTPGTYTIVVSSNNCVDFTFDVVVKIRYDSIVASIAKSVYYVGEELELDGLVVTANSVSYPSATLSASDYAVDSSLYNKNAVGTYQLFISADGLYTTVSVTVKNRPTLQVSGYKSVFIVGTEFNAGAIVVKKNDNGTITTLTDYALDSSTFNKDVVGKYTITVTADGISTTYTVVVRELVMTGITVSGAKNSFAYNEEFSSAGLVVKAVYEDGSEVEVTDYAIDFSAYDKAVAGSYTIVVSYNGKSAGYTVTVAQPLLSGITVSGAKNSFAYNEEFSSAGLVVKAVYEDGSEVEITDYAIDSSVYNKAVAGSYTIVVSYNGKSASYTVTVAQAPASNDSGNGGCAGKAMEILGLVTMLCAIAFVGKKVGM